METTATKIRVGPKDHGRAMPLSEFAEAEAEPGYLYELSGGTVEVTGIPGLRHALVITALHEQIVLWKARNQGVIHYLASGDRCKLLLPGMASERHPDLAIYLSSPPPGLDQPWAEWIPDIVCEVVSKSSAVRDYEVKRREYLHAGVREYWIVDPDKTAFLVLRHEGDVFREQPADLTYETSLLPGLRLDVRKVLAAASV